MNLHFVSRFLDPGNPGGGSLPPSFADIMDTGVEADGVTVKPGWERDPITGAVTRLAPLPPQQTPPVKTPPAQTPQEGVNPDGTLMEGYKKEEDGTVVKIEQDPVPDPVTPEQALEEDGVTLKPGFIKNEDGTYAVDPDYDPNDPDPDDETGMKFIGAIEAITGMKYDIEYPENVHPTSPEGLALREKTVAEKAQLDYDTYLRTTDPRSYAYMLHRAQGGTDEEFFGDSRGFILPEEQELNGSADKQAEVYKHDLLSMGLEPAQAQLLVDSAIKDNSLEAKAKASWTKIDTGQKKQLKELADRAAAKETQFANSLRTVTDNLMKSVKSEISIAVPETEQKKLVDYIVSNMRYDDGKFYIVQELGDTLKTMVESMFFQMKGGNLDSLIKKRVDTKAAQQLRLKLKDTGKGPGSGSGVVDTQKKNLPLSAILPKGPQ